MAMDPFSVYKKQLAWFFTLLLILLALTGSIYSKNPSYSLKNGFFTNINQQSNFLINK